MNISYNWLKQYINIDITPDELSKALTSIGLEVGGVDEVQTVKGGLEGLVIGDFGIKAKQLYSDMKISESHYYELMNSIGIDPTDDTNEE